MSGPVVEQPAPSVAPAAVVGDALSILRRRFRRVFGAGLIVFGIGALLEIPVLVLLDRWADEHPLIVAAEIVATSFTTFGLTFYSGLIDRTVAEEERDDPPQRLPEIIRTLPYGRLIVADILLTVGAAFFTLFLVIPGLYFFTCFVLVGPMIMMEDRGVVDAFRRSRHLVQGHFWLVFFLVTVPVQIEESIVHGFEVASDESLLVSSLVNVVIGVALVSVVGLVEVTLAYRLAAAAPE